jgi:GTP cyclohydrolase II
MLVERTPAKWTDRSESPFSTDYGTFILRAYQFPDGSEHAALLSGASSPTPAPLLRLQSSCVTGSTFRAQLCDCRQQLEAALAMVASGGGCVIHLDQEGRGHGLVEKVRHFALIGRGLNTYEAAVARGVDADLRNYSQAVAIVQDIFGSSPVRLLTNNPHKLRELVAAGLNVATREPIETEPTDTNRAYLEVKRSMGHLLTL